jgi:hypothetical protein
METDVLQLFHYRTVLDEMHEPSSDCIQPLRRARRGPSAGCDRLRAFAFWASGRVVVSSQVPAWAHRELHRLQPHQLGTPKQPVSEGLQELSGASGETNPDRTESLPSWCARTGVLM